MVLGWWLMFSNYVDSNKLTPAELAVMKLVVEGHTNGEIAILLGSKENTVKHQMYIIMQKQAVETRTRLIAKYYKRKIARIEKELRTPSATFSNLDLDPLNILPSPKWGRIPSVHSRPTRLADVAWGIAKP